MKMKHLLFLLLTLVTFALCSCGSGGAGRNGSIEVTLDQVPTGSATITGTAVYKNPTQGNVIGTQMTLSAIIGGEQFTITDTHTNNSGGITFYFTPPAFVGTRTVIIEATSDNLVGVAQVQVTGLSLALTAPASREDLTTTASPGTPVAFTIDPTTAFATVTDPFTGATSGHPLTISATVTKMNPADTLNVPTSTTTTSGGTALLPAVTGTLITPSTVGGVERMIITWTVTDTVTGLTSNAVTTVRLTKTA